MGVALSRQSPGMNPGWPPSDINLLRGVDQVLETRGAGVVLLNGLTRTLRITRPGKSTVVLEVRPSPVARTRKAAPLPRTKDSSPAQEWLGFGLNCSGATLAWVGVVGTAATAPVTGGQSLWGTAALWGGALAASGACGVSIFRVGSMIAGYESINQRLDRSGFYIWTMRGLDVVGLLGVHGAIKDIMETRDVLESSGLGWRRAMVGEVSRPQRREVTSGLGLTGAKRVKAPVIGTIVKQRLLAGIAAGVGLVESAGTGAVHDLVVWIVSPHQH